jgi:hypothetical protein
MTAGNQYTADTINANSAGAVVQVRDSFDYLAKQYDWLNTLGATGIQGAPTVGGKPAITSADATTILAALSDLFGLYQLLMGQTCSVGYGSQHITGSYNFMTFGNQLTNGA